MADKEFSVLDLLDLDLKGHNSLNLRCAHGRRGLVREITIPDISSAPIMPISNVFMLAIIVRPLVPPTSAAKLTPKELPHCDSIVLKK